MAVLKDEKREVEVKDGERTINAAEELGVSFGCREGLCGACKVEVLEGMENLAPKNEQENDMGLEGNERLMCQCVIKHGTVKIKY